MDKHYIFSKNNIKLDNYNLLLGETLFHNANGYIGVRSAFEEGYPQDFSTIRGQYINGFYDFAPANQAECLYGLVQEKQTMLNVADTQSINVELDGERFSMFEGTVLESRRWVDMKNGISGRFVRWCSPLGKEIEITSVRMTSFTQLSLFTIDYTIRPTNFSGKVRITSSHSGNVSNFFDTYDPRTADHPMQFLQTVDCSVIDDASYIISKTSRSSLTVCSGVAHSIPDGCTYKHIVHKNNAQCIISADLQADEALRVIKYSVFCDSLRTSNLKVQIKAEIKKAIEIPINHHYKQQKSYLKSYWQNCCVEIEGDELLNIALKFNLYQLLQSVSKDNHSNISPKGLSGEGYEGQYFWDSEMYIQPFFTITNPQVTKQLISYRYSTLKYAKENARILGHSKGALYPWRTIMGKECSGYFPAGSAQYHINGAVAYAIISYYLATKDKSLILEQGAEIIYETARLWMDVGNFYNNEFHINDVTGPDEYTCIVNNNYYTNALAQYHLKWAVKLYELFKDNSDFRLMQSRIMLSYNEISNFKKAATLMSLPYDEKLGINPQDDSFLQKKRWNISTIPKENFPLLLHYHPLHLYRYQVCKQPDTVLAHFILEDIQPIETIQKSFCYYEKITTHDSSLSGCIFSIVAAKLGMVDKAIEYFDDSTQLDLMDLHHNTKDGIHTANMGGNYMAIVYGFGGFRLKESGISFAPILPEPWSGYHFCICYENSRISVNVGKKRCVFSLEGGSSKEITVYGKTYTLKNELTVKCKE